MLLKLLGCLLFAGTLAGDEMDIQQDLAAHTGKMVKAFVKVNTVLKTLVKHEMDAVQDYVGIAILNQLKAADPSTELDAVKPMIQEHFSSMLAINQDCIVSGGMVWFANTALRATEKYQDLFLRADAMQYCFQNFNEELTKICSSALSRYDNAVRAIAKDLLFAMGRVENVYHDTMSCLRNRYDLLLKRIESNPF